MALIHEKLYQSDDFRCIKLDEYIPDLTKNLMRTYQITSSHIQMKVDIDQNIFLDLDTLTPCGLIICELISNSLKYAFKPNISGMIWIQAKFDPDKKLTLIIGDNGKGLPADIDFNNIQSLGLQVVKDLTDQLQGNLIINREVGTEFKIQLGRLKID
jgi:two-component sensor histidine kinase